MLNDGIDLSKWIKLFLVAYGALILLMFFISRNLEWQHMVVPILLFGFHNIIMNYLTEKVAYEH